MVIALLIGGGVAVSIFGVRKYQEVQLRQEIVGAWDGAWRMSDLFGPDPESSTRPAEGSVSAGGRLQLARDALARIARATDSRVRDGLRELLAQSERVQISGRLTLRADGTYAERSLMTYAGSDDRPLASRPFTLQTAERGRWVMSGSTLALVWEDVAVVEATDRDALIDREGETIRGGPTSARSRLATEVASASTAATSAATPLAPNPGSPLEAKAVASALERVLRQRRREQRYTVGKLTDATLELTAFGVTHAYRRAAGPDATSEWPATMPVPGGVDPTPVAVPAPNPAPSWSTTPSPSTAPSTLPLPSSAPAAAPTSAPSVGQSLAATETSLPRPARRKRAGASSARSEALVIADGSRECGPHPNPLPAYRERGPEAFPQTSLALAPVAEGAS